MKKIICILFILTVLILMTGCKVAFSKNINKIKQNIEKTPINKEGIRVMTPSEWGRLQGFIGYAFIDSLGNDSFSFPEGIQDGQKYKQFGNAVSIPVIKTMASFMSKCFDELSNSNEKRVFDLIKELKSITRKDATDALGLSYQQVNYFLNKLINHNLICSEKSGKTQRFFCRRRL